MTRRRLTSNERREPPRPGTRCPACGERIMLVRDATTGAVFWVVTDTGRAHCEGVRTR